MVDTKTGTTPQFYDHLMQSVAEGLLVLDEQSYVISANEAATAMLGYEPGGLIGRHQQEFWPEDSSVNADDKATTLRQRNGRSLLVTLSITPLPTKDDNYKLVSITSLDNIQRLNEALSHTQRLAGIGILTASVAHELNTPISILTATCSNLHHEVEDNSLTTEQLERYIEMIEQSAWRCARIVEVLRNYTYEDEPQVAITNLNMIIEDGLTLVRHQFRGQYNIQIETELAPDLKSIVCDHNRMTQVLINLLTNARDAMLPDGGTVRIKSWAIPPAAAPSSLNGTDSPNNKTVPEQFAFSVQDSGHGISPQIMDRIFDPFFTTKSNGKGTGLGLFITRRIVTQHNGRIWAENNPGSGATFTVVLPRTQ